MLRFNDILDNIILTTAMEKITLNAYMVENVLDLSFLLNTRTYPFTLRLKDTLIKSLSDIQLAKNQ